VKEATHSGRHALANRLRELGANVDDAAVDELLVRFKRLAESKKNVGDEDLLALLALLASRPARDGSTHASIFASPFCTGASRAEAHPD
jgi:isopropylmalate/homocitrate/citramalate synthase